MSQDTFSHGENGVFTDVGFIYQDVAKLREEEGTQEYSPPDLLDATLEGLSFDKLSFTVHKLQI